MTETTKERISGMVGSHRVLLFMKGNRTQPQCGFSARVVGILDDILPEYETFDVLQDSEIREGIKEFSNWPTIPQLYVGGELVGGADIVGEMYDNGELFETLGVEAPERKIPSITVADEAATLLREHLSNAPGRFLHLAVDANFEPSLGLAPRQGGEVEVTAGDLTLLMDWPTAARADGVSITVEQTERGPAFRVNNPNAPAPVQQLSPSEVKKLLDDGVQAVLVDVRTPEEREIAAIAGTRLLDQEYLTELEAMPKDTMLIFQCHHGNRSNQAAEHFRSRGFTNVHNLAGGIDAWSTEVDPSVPRY